MIDVCMVEFVRTIKVQVYMNEPIALNGTEKVVR